MDVLGKRGVLWFALWGFLGLWQIHGQLQGKVTDQMGAPLPFVNIYFENTAIGTTTNESGDYTLPIATPGNYTVVFKYLGFQTKTISLKVAQLPQELDVILTAQVLALKGVALNAKNNPANRVVKKAIANRKQYQQALASYTAEFYAKGLIRIKEAPKRILGQDLGDLGGGLDSTRSGIIYLSETLSQIAKKNKDFKEHIIASKVSGDDNGFSFNTASDVNFSFYNNTVTFGNELVSPIASNAFAYYRYKLVGTFYDEGNRLINKIKVIPRRKNDRVFTGEMFIVEDSWALYGLNLKVTGEQAQILPADTINLRQEFNFIPQQNKWLKTLQRIDFKYGLLGIKGSGSYTAGYANYEISPAFDQKAFTNEVLSFKDQANKKDSLFWQGVRPVPLTQEERVDYTKKDSLQLIRKSKKYLDSVDAKGNKFKLTSLFLGYTYSNTYKDRYYTITSPLLTSTFNTVQGFRTSVGFGYLKRDKARGSQFNIKTSVDYGFSDKRLRPYAAIGYRFNNFSRPYLKFSGGNQLLQFNNSNPIGPRGNSIASLLFENNLAKFYEKDFAALFYSHEWFNGVYFYGELGFEERKPLFNTTSFAIFYGDSPYTSNNPLAPTDFENAAIAQHHIFKFSAQARIRFGQKYLSYPDGKFSYSEDRYPTLFVGYEKGFASNDAGNNYDQLKLRLTQNFAIADKGRFAYNLRAGAFFGADDISFVDYQHFNGNRTRVTRGSYLNSFFLLSYYGLSTNQNYFEGHLEHNFQGYVMGKLPLLKHLKSHLILNGKILAISSNRPYYEWGVSLGNLGWKKFRFLRVGFVQSHFDRITENGLNIGLQF